MYTSTVAIIRVNMHTFRVDCSRGWRSARSLLQHRILQPGLGTPRGNGHNQLNITLVILYYTKALGYTIV